jgi:hypothetical protein
MIGSICAIALAAGCSNHVDHDSAVRVMNSALAGTVAADGQVVHVDWTSAGGHVDVALTNPAGTGSAQVVGTVTKNGSTTQESIDVTFNQWHDAIHNVTLDGTLHEAGTFSAPLPLAGDVTLSGAVAASGNVNAMVDFDLMGSYSASGFAVHGDVGGNTIDVSLP